MVRLFVGCVLLRLRNCYCKIICRLCLAEIYFDKKFNWIWCFIKIIIW